VDLVDGWQECEPGRKSQPKKTKKRASKMCDCDLSLVEEAHEEQGG